MGLKKAFLEGSKTPLLGAFLGVAEPVLAETLGRAGYDFMILDTEHAGFSRRELEECLRAADYAGMPGIVRVPALNDWRIQEALDAGAQGVQIPSVETPEQAAAAVSASHFPPRGRRGFGSTTRAADYGFLPRKEIVSRAEAETTVIIQIESRRGVENLESIVAVEGVDVIFIGTSDLSLDYGFSSPLAPEMTPLISEIVGKATAAGKVCGVHTTDKKLVAELMKLGVRFFTIAAMAVVVEALRDLRIAFRRESGSDN